MKLVKPVPAASHEMPRFTFRIPATLHRDLHALGEIEKRQMARLARECLATALKKWHKKHPGRSPLKSAAPATAQPASA